MIRVNIINMAKKANSQVASSTTVVVQPLPVKKASIKHKDYTSEGVEDNDIFQLPSSDWQALILITFVGAVVRLFRIYQPSSVVFDEVQ